MFQRQSCLFRENILTKIFFFYHCVIRASKDPALFFIKYIYFFFLFQRTKERQLKKYSKTEIDSPLNSSFIYILSTNTEHRSIEANTSLTGLKKKKAGEMMKRLQKKKEEKNLIRKKMFSEKK